MKGRLTAVTAVVATLAVGFALVGHHAAGRVVEAASPAPTDMMAMTASEHIAHLAMAGDPHAQHALMEAAWAPLQAAPNNTKLPADDQGAKARLESSPRKGRYVTINVNGAPITAWVVTPQNVFKAPVVVVIQEIFGLSDWIRGVADQLAAEGFIAIAPDLLSGHGPDGGDSRAFPDVPAMQQVTLMLPPAEITERLKAARDYGLRQPEANGKSASIGFCFGGSQSFKFATDEPGLNAAVVFYGAAPTDVPAAPRGATPPPFVPSPQRLAAVKAPILGFYGGPTQDPGIGRTVDPTDAKMKELKKTYEPHVIDGAAHGFLRAQTGNDGANMKATEQAWPMTVAWIRKYAS